MNEKLDRLFGQRERFLGSEGHGLMDPCGRSGSKIDDDRIPGGIRPFLARMGQPVNPRLIRFLIIDRPAERHHDLRHLMFSIHV